MDDDGSRLPWTEDQWACVQRLVQESAARARVASSLLPLVGPLPEGQASVPALELRQGKPYPAWYGSDQPGIDLQRFDIDDAITKSLTTIACEVYLKTQQAADPELASARQMLSRAAVIIGRLEDAIVFEGQPGSDEPPSRDGDPLVTPPVYTVRGGGYPGLRLLAPRDGEVVVAPAEAEVYGENLVDGVVEAIDKLEKKGQYGPFGVVLGHDLYEAAHHPSASMVLPSDRFVPFLAGGPLLRSSLLPPEEGLVVASAGAPIDLVLATDVHVSYVQRTIEPRYVLRVSERLALRAKQTDAISHLVPPESPEG